jgi:F0F1-type ATP synthase membrane subunit b/b'
MADQSQERSLADIQNDYQASCASAGHTNYLLGIAKANLNKLEAEMSALTQKLAGLNAEADALAAKAKASAANLAQDAKDKAANAVQEIKEEAKAEVAKVKEKLKKAL